MIVDTHVHYSEPPSAERPYDAAFANSETFKTGSAPMPLEDVLATTASAGVDRIVQVTQTKMGYDNRYGVEGAALHPDRIVGVIGRFDPLAPGLADRLEEYASQPFILGVRFTLLTAQTKPWLEDGSLDAFFAAAEKFDVAVQIYAPYQAVELRDAARRFRGVRFLIDHMALDHQPPRPLEEVLGNWEDVLTLAQEPNVWMKVSYFPEAAHVSEHFPYPRAQQSFQQLYERVGAARLIWGSNFPPVAAVCTYRQSVDFVREHCSFLLPADRDAIMGGNFLDDFADA